jgi:hypothetical protein
MTVVSLIRSVGQVWSGPLPKPRSAARFRTAAFRSDALRSSAYTGIVTGGFAWPASLATVAASSSRSTIRWDVYVCRNEMGRQLLAVGDVDLRLCYGLAERPEALALRLPAAGGEDGMIVRHPG